MTKEQRAPFGKAGRTNEEIELRNELELERDLQKDVHNLLRQRDILVITNRFGKRSTATKGVPDFNFLWNCRGYAFECKVGNRQPSQKQLETHMHMRRNGWLVFVVRTLNEARDFLDGKLQVLK